MPISVAHCIVGLPKYPTKDHTVAGQKQRTRTRNSQHFADISLLCSDRRSFLTPLYGRAKRGSKGPARSEMGRWWMIAALIGAIAAAKALGGKHLGLDKDSAVAWLRETSDRLGFWAIPAYVGLHTLTLALCLPYAVFFEAGASLLFGFFPAVLCVFSAKVLGASLSFWIGRLVFRSSSSAAEWVYGNKYFHMISKGVERDGWKFVVLARFSPLPSYMINYALAATKVRFLVDFLFPTVVGCLPMILQNTSIGSLAGAAVSSASGSQKSQIWSYIFPLLGILSSILISLRIKKYSAEFSLDKTIPGEGTTNPGSTQRVSDRKESNVQKRNSKD